MLVAAGVGWWLLRPAPSVVFLGDSITVVSDPQIEAALGSDYSPHMNAVLGIQAAQMLPAAEKAAKLDPDQVVIELGSNDVLHGASIDGAAGDLLHLVALFPHARCIHVVNINTHMTDNGNPLGPRAGTLNVDLSHLHEKDARVDVIDWNRTTSTDIAAHPPLGTLTGDTVHPNVAGRTLLAKQIKAALDACGNA